MGCTYIADSNTSASKTGNDDITTFLPVKFCRFVGGIGNAAARVARLFAPPLAAHIKTAKLSCDINSFSKFIY